MIKKDVCIIQGQGWVNDKYVDVTFVKAADCGNDKERYREILRQQEEMAVSEVYETHMKHRVGNHPEWGERYWEGCENTERGACLFYYAQTKPYPWDRQLLDILAQKKVDYESCDGEMQYISVPYDDETKRILTEIGYTGTPEVDDDGNIDIMPVACEVYPNGWWFNGETFYENKEEVL